jgi:hypothetical protein
VARALTTHELGRCLDLSDNQLVGFKNKQLSSTSLGEITFSDSAPGKLLHALVEVLGKRIQITQRHEREAKPQPNPKFSVASSPTTLDPKGTKDPADTLGREKAAKNDDADVSIMQWDDKVLAPWFDNTFVIVNLKRFEERFGTDVLTVFRQVALRRWRRNLLRSFSRYMSQHYPRPWQVKPVDRILANEWKKDVSGAADCLRRAAGASWWDWDHGSRLFFWRWPAEARVWARDGLPIYHQPSLLPQYRTRQPPESDEDVRHKVELKLEKFRARRYICQGTVHSLTPYFTVPKGDGDVRVVFDGTKSKLNEALWAPPFVLPTIGSLLRCVEPGTWMADIDIGEMFYNYALDPEIQKYCGVDLSPYLAEVSTWEVWTRCVMGIRSSPHGCTLMEMIGDEMARGASGDSTNPFAFDTVRLNLPGSHTYCPSFPWVSKVVLSTGRIAPDVKTYVDDKRVTGPTQALCELAARRAASMLTYLGEQDACRKRVAASRRAGAWAGSVCHTDGDVVTVLVTG